MTETTSKENSSGKRNVCLHGWKIRDIDHDVCITQVGVGVQVVPRLPGGVQVAELGDFLALIREIALESDLLMPLIVALQMGEHDQDGCLELLRECRRQQAFHRGKFLLLPIDSGQESEKILGALLNPEAEDINAFEPPKTLELAEFWDRLKETSLADHFEDQLAAWESVPRFGSISPKEKKEYWVKVWEQLFKSKEIYQLEQYRPPVMQADVSPTKPDSICTRITSARIQNFKGLKDTGDIDLDADIVLLTGANGNGKSSFIEALTFALTGYHPDCDRDSQKPTDHFFFSPTKANEFSITLNIESFDQKTEKPNQTYSGSIHFSKQRGDVAEGTGTEEHLDILRLETVIEGEAAGKEIFVPVGRQLHFRMTSYLPEHVNMLFEENVASADRADKEDDKELSHCLEPADRVNVLRHLFPALAPEIEALCAVVHKEMGEIDDELDRVTTAIEGVENFADRFSKFTEFFSRVQKLIRELPVTGAREWTINAGWHEPPEDVPAYLALLEDEKKSLEQLFSSTLPSWSGLPDMITRYGDTMPDARRQQQQLHDLERKIDQVRQKIRELEAKLDHPDVGSEVLTNFRDFCRFLLVKRQALLDELERFTDESGSALIKEVKRVDKGKLKLAEQVLSGILGQYQESIARELEEAKESLRSLEEQRVDISQQYADTESFQRLEEFFDASDRQKWLRVLDNDYQGSLQYRSLIEERDALTEKWDRLAQLSDFIEQQRLVAGRETESSSDWSLSRQPLSLRGALESALNTVLRRFVMAGGMDRIQVSEQYALKADVEQQDEDKKRGLPCFSSGQKAQIGMAWMVAVRELIQSKKNREVIHFPHRILIMDDPSTTFDITNLLSQAILWRQLAYNRDPDRRYQVFIVSHHEEFSSHLLDLLCPPPGYSMRLVRFVDWDPENGAKIRTFDVEPSPVDMQRGPEASGQDDQDGLAGARKAFRDGLSRMKEMVV